MRVSVRFLGCKVSHADAMLVRDALVDAGHVETTPEAAEVHVLNTCALTVEAERKSRRQANRAGRSGRVFVTGCAANLHANQFRGPGVTVVPGSADRVASDLVELLGGARRNGACAEDRAPAARGRTRAFLKAQNGCDSACAFCIIPTTRGPAESRPLARLLAEGRRRLGEGHPELVLTGINIGTYRDPDSGADLAALVDALGALEGLRRLRISSIEPGDVGERLLRSMARSPVVAPHLHVPLQSGSVRLLEAMGRRYTVAQYLDACRAARATVPRLNLTTDAIAGFPGERQEDAAATAAVVEELAMGRVHVFPFSPRSGTRAASMGGHLTPQVIRERAGRLRDLSDHLAAAHRRRRVGTDDVVLLERVHPDGTRSGLGADYTRFVLPPGPERPGDMVAVRAESVAGEHVVGRPR